MNVAERDRAAPAPIPFYVPLAVTALVGAAPGLALIVWNARRLRCANMGSIAAVAAATLMLVAALYLAREAIGLEMLARMTGLDASTVHAMTVLGLSCVGLAGAMVATLRQMDAFRFAIAIGLLGIASVPLVRCVIVIFGYVFLTGVLARQTAGPLGDAIDVLLFIRAAG